MSEEVAMTDIRTAAGPKTPEDIALRAAAVKNLEARRGLQAHVLAYILVNGFLVFLWWTVTGAGFFWPVFPLFGWGIGLAFNIWDVVSPEPSSTRIDAEMERLRRRSN
jgi:hypothetical protein